MEKTYFYFYKPSVYPLHQNRSDQYLEKFRRSIFLKLKYKNFKVVKINITEALYFKYKYTIKIFPHQPKKNCQLIQKLKKVK